MENNLKSLEKNISASNKETKTLGEKSFGLKKKDHSEIKHQKLDFKNKVDIIILDKTSNENKLKNSIVQEIINEEEQKGNFQEFIMKISINYVRIRKNKGVKIHKHQNVKHVICFKNDENDILKIDMINILNETRILRIMNNEDDNSQKLKILEKVKETLGPYNFDKIERSNGQLRISINIKKLEKEDITNNRNLNETFLNSNKKINDEKYTKIDKSKHCQIGTTLLNVIR